MDKLIVGCGYLGRRVAARWQSPGDRVFGTTRSAAGAEQLRRLGIEPVVCDVLNPESLQNLPAAETALYCIGFDRNAGRSMREVYVEGLRNFLACCRSKSGRFLYVSSTGVYGQCNGEEVDESATTEPVEESGRVVLEAEKVLIQTGANATVLRFTGIYGPGRVIRRQSIETGEPILGDPEKWLNVIHVEDGASAVIAAEKNGRPGSIYNVTDDCPVRRRDFYLRLAELLGAPPPRFVPPAPGARLPPHESTNRRIINRRMHEELLVKLRYPSYREGLPAALTPDP